MANPSVSAMRYASVCDGIGAVHVAWQPLGWRCAWTSEIEPFPAAVVEHRYGFCNLGDMTQITTEMLHERGTVDLLVGGTPCQSFSVAGLRRGLADPRGNLALRFVQLAAVMQPQWIVWENVPGVLSSNKGRDFGTFLGALVELGYGFAYRVLDAQWFGVAQRRRRVFVVCHLGDWRRAAAVLFERESVFGDPPSRAKSREGVARPVASSLTSSGRGVARTGQYRGQDDVVMCHSAHDMTGSTGDGLARCITTGEHSRQDWETCNLIAAAASQDVCGGSLVTSFHPTQDPISSVDGSTHAMGCGSRSGCATHAVAFTAKDCGGDASHEVSPTMRAMGHSGSHANGGGQLAVAFPIDGGNQAASVEVHHTLRTGRDAGDAVAFKPSHYTRGKDGAPSEVTAPLTADADKGDQDTVIACQPVSGHSDGSHQGVDVVVFKPKYMTRDNPKMEGAPRVDGTTFTCLTNNTGYNAQCVATAMAVRRLTPRECERLQGFPDDYTLVEYRKKPAADGPRYRALGNSMAVPVMRWIGERIAMVDQL